MKTNECLPEGQPKKERGSPRRWLATDHAQKACDQGAKGYEGMRRSQSADPSHYLKVK